MTLRSALPARALTVAVLLLSFLALPALPAHAGTDDYPYRGAVCASTGSTSGSCPNYDWRVNGAEFDPWGFAFRNCTSWVAWRMRNTNGVDFFNGMRGGRWGNANTWDDNARALGYAVDNRPAAGAIAQTDDGSFGHVAWVAAVNSDGSVVVEDYNYAGTGVFARRTVSAAAFRYLHVKDLPTGSAEPFGSFDVAESPEAGRVRVAGWAIDNDARTSPVSIHAYVGGEAGNPAAEGHDLGAASGDRPDVGAAHPGAGNAHGVDATFTTGKTGAQAVCLYAINIGGGSNPLLGCRTVTIVDPHPFGSFDEATGSPGGVLVRGWTIDRSAAAAPTGVHIYIGGQAGQAGAEGHDIGAAADDRQDVAAAYPGTGSSHGFSTTVTTARRGDQTVCAYAINLGAAGENRLLMCRSATIADPPASNPSSAPSESAQPTAAASPSAMPLPSAPAHAASPSVIPSRAPEPGPSSTPVTVELGGPAISAGELVTVTYRGTPGATLDVLARTQPATAFSRIGSVTLDGSGSATSSHRPQKNTRITARSSDGVLSGNQPLVQVRSVASMTASRVGSRTYAFTGRVYPALDNRLVNIYRNSVLVAQARSDASGIYRVTRTLGAGTSTFLARSPNDTYNLGATSPARQVLIR
ncbi:MAG: N-acetylmuramoyl-L-alanine amidase [Frankiales bacterium]|nr:N-acetylmuramoyl-L-alanine amidase [Frankiales bacterium]